jgi:signal transduction histidine kinase
MERVVKNILQNSAEAVKADGQITVRTKNVSLGEQEVKPHKIRAGKYIEISIADNGIGMDKDIMDKIFDPFFTTKSRGAERGCGLGLSSVYRTVKNHDGMIKVQSKPSQGAVFRVYLPAPVKSVPKKAAPVETISPEANGAALEANREASSLHAPSL